MPHNPHDALAKHVLSDPKIAAGELASVLPAAILAELDLDRLRVCSGSFVDDELTQLHADLLYSAPARNGGSETYIYVLVEHRSTGDPRLPFRMLRYMVQIWEKRLRENPTAKKLPPILPFVLHHDVRRLSGPVSLGEMLEGSPELLAALRPHTPDFRFVLDDLAIVSDDALRQRIQLASLGRIALWALRASRSGPDVLLADLGVWSSVVAEVLATPRGRDAFAVVVGYLLGVEHLSRDELAAVLERDHGAKGREVVVTEADMLRQEGIKMGLEMGLEMGLAGMRGGIRRVLVRQGVSLSSELEARLESCRDLAVLERWLDAAVATPTAPDLFR